MKSVGFRPEILAVLLCVFVVSSSTAPINADIPAEAPVCSPDGICASSTDDKIYEENDGEDVEDDYVDDEFEPSDVEWCRRRPTWRYIPKDNGDEEESSIDIWEKCQKVLDYYPDLEELTAEKVDYLASDYDPITGENRDEDYSDDVYQELPVLERPLVKLVATCMDDILAESEHYKTNGSNTGTLKRPFIAREYFRDDFDDLVVMAIVEDALCEEEAETVLALTECAKKHLPGAFEHRTFDNTDEGGGNDTTFLAGYLQILAPGVAARTFLNAQLVWETVGWADDEDESFEPADLYYYDAETEDVNAPESTEFTRRWFPEPLFDCGIRTSEHLSYDTWGVLGYHEDTGSDYTVLAALSDPDSYEGGEFSLCPLSEYSRGIDHVDKEGRRYFSSQNDDDRKVGRDCPDRITVKPKRLSAIVFQSIFSHGVEGIRSPGRVMFTNEFWRYGDVPASVMRPGILDFVLGLSGDDDELFDHDYEDEYEDEDEDLDERFEDINEGVEE